MRLIGRFVAVALLLPVSSLAAAAAGSGAKDIFYDPVQRTGVGVQLPAGTSSANSLLPIQPAPPKPPKPNPPAKARKVAHRPVVVPAQPEAAGKVRGLHYWIELEDAQGEGSYVSDRQVFHSGQRIRLHFVSNADGRILLLQMGTSKTATLLFPAPSKGLAENSLKAGEERVLPSDTHWFRFDAQPGTEKLLVLFARDTTELERFRVKPEMDLAETQALILAVHHAKGSKDLVLETETETPSEVGTYGVNLRGEPVVLEIDLRHQ